MTDPAEPTPQPPSTTPGLTVGQLRKLLEGVPDDLCIVVRSTDDDNFCGGILGAQVEHAHDEDDTPFFAIDCSAEEDRYGRGRVTDPSDPPRLFGVAMEYDSVIGHWLDFGPIGVRLNQDETDDTWSFGSGRF